MCISQPRELETCHSDILQMDLRSEPMYPTFLLCRLWKQELYDVNAMLMYRTRAQMVMLSKLS
jgi:hypothetical protein